MLVVVLGLLWNVPFMYQDGGLDDEAVTTLGAFRVLAGELPYRDFDTRHTPGCYFTAACGYAFLGQDITATRVLMLLNASLLGLAVFALASRLQGERQALIPWLLFSFTGVTQWPILSYHWMAILPYLLGIWAVLAERWALAGAAAALAAWYLQSDGLALILTLALFAGAHWRRAAAGLVGTSLVLWLPLLVWVSPALIWQQNVTSMRWHVPFNHCPFSLTYVTAPAEAVWAQLGQGGWSWPWLIQSLSYLGVWTFKYALYYPILLAILWRGLRRGGACRRLAAAQLVLTLALWNRQDMLYLNYLTPLFYVLVCALWPGRWRYALAALFLVQYAFMCQDARGYRHPIESLYGTVYTRSEEGARAANALFALARRFTPPGTPVFAYPYAPSFYVFTQTRDASRFPLLVPLLYPRSDAEAVQRELKVPLVYRMALSPAVVADYPSITGPQFAAEMEAFDRILLQDYERVGAVGGTEVYRRRESPRPEPKGQ